LAGCCRLLQSSRTPASSSQLSPCSSSWLLLAGVRLLAAAHQQQPAAASHVKFLFSRVTLFMTNNFSLNPVFCVRNGSVTDEEDDLHRQTQVFVLGI
jgi:hypothetical protein